jgi:DNA-binding CsgD family transcriptional regulator
MPSPHPHVAPAPGRRGSIRAAVRLVNPLDPARATSIERKRRLVADLCRILGDQLGGGYAARDGNGNGHGNRTTAPADAVVLSPRMRQTLERLLAGDSEKEIAARLGLSRHTVHVYVKTLYRRFDVCSRGELLARFVRKD